MEIKRWDVSLLKTIEDILGVELSAKHDIINPVLEDTVNE